MNNDIELTLLSTEEIWGENSLDVLKKYGIKTAKITDLCALTYGIDQFWTRSDNGDNDVITIGPCCNFGSYYRDGRDRTIRPVLQSSVIFSQIFSNRTKGYNGTEEVTFGEYPQNAADPKMQNILESEYTRGMTNTGRHYTFDSAKADEYDEYFIPVTFEEYEYQGKRYIRVIFYNNSATTTTLSNGVAYRDGDHIWLEVSPVKWLIDDKTKTLISKKGLISGIRFLDSSIPYKGNFSETEMYMFLNKYMVKDLFQNKELLQIQSIDTTDNKKQVKKRVNPYGLQFGQVSEEDIIKGAIESGVAVFLHGPSSEGKSARVKQIDPTCEIIYLRNATPESLNGKSVYNQSTGEMIDIKPSWLRKVEEKCKNEPDKLHIVFFDEITNALPSIQGIAFNIVLDREVNGIWKLPDNARIVAAGNDMKDSLAANQLAEPLFNRFAHVYIKTTTESWLKWVSENNIHPAIYSYIAYKNGEVLRSEYDGEKPNADPRKWEMASKMLYKTGNPEMLRALVGEDITREFAEFCNQQVITLEDVVNDNYTEQDIQLLNTAERYATTMGLLQVDIDNLDKVRKFLLELGKEFCSIFDLKWCHGDEERLELIAELKLTKTKVKVR